jgi:methylmalonyl-CoA epimerase
MTVMKLDHVGIIVKNVDATAAAVERTIGLKLTETAIYKDILKIGFIPIGGVDIELLEPITSEGLNAEFLRDRGEGVHHMAFQVDNLDAAVAAAVEQGAQVILGPTEGARGKRIVFLAGDELGGTIIELLETPASTA